MGVAPMSFFWTGYYLLGGYRASLPDVMKFLIFLNTMENLKNINKNISEIQEFFKVLDEVFFFNRLEWFKRSSVRKLNN